MDNRYHFVRSMNKSDLTPQNNNKRVLRLRCAPLERVRIGFIGVGARGVRAVERMMNIEGAEEYAEGHIPGTNFNIDVLKGQFTSQALKLLPKDKSVALYCRSGNRSKTAARILAENGYKVLELATGIRGWISEGRPIEK